MAKADDRAGAARADDRAARREMLRLYGAAALAGIAALAIAYQFVDPAPPSNLRLATGGPTGAYFAFGKQYRDVLARHGIEVEIVNTSGSIENLRLLRDPEAGVHAAFAQGGTAGAEARAAGLVSLASLYYEPAWLFYGDSLPLASLADLAGRRVAVGPEGSGARALALVLLAENGLDADDAALSPLGGADAFTALQTGEIDAWFTVAGVRSALVRSAAATEGVRIFDFARAEAYERRLRYLSALVLPRGALDLAANLPDRDVRLVSPTAALVARSDLHAALEYLLLEAASEIHSGGGILEEPEMFPGARFADLPLAEAARRYFRSGPPFLRRVLPFWAANTIDRLAVMLLPLLAVALPLFRFMPVLYEWRVRSRIYRWYRDLRPLERRLKEGLDPREAERALERLDGIERALAGLSVPLAYADALYQLRLHIDLVRGAIQRAAKRPDASDAPEEERA